MKTEKETAVLCDVCNATPSLGPCRHCGGEVCGAHSMPQADDSVVCRACSYKGAMGDVTKHVEAKEQSFAGPQSLPGEGPGRVRKIMGLALLVAVVVELVLVYHPIAARVLAEEEAYSFGPGGTDEPGLNDAVQGLWQVRSAMDEYVHEHGGRPPATLSQLGGEDLAECPGCGKAWIYEKAGERGFLIACPDPAAHGRMGVFLSHRYGPPQVRLFSEASVR